MAEEVPANDAALVRGFLTRLAKLGDEQFTDELVAFAASGHAIYRWIGEHANAFPELTDATDDLGLVEETATAPPGEVK